MRYISYKRIFDIVLSFFLIVFLFPFLIILSISVFFHFNSNPIFIQERVGINCTRFKIFKFKTMNNGNSEQLTRYGRLLRKYSIDELPQLFNVLFGTMSLVGPRPLLVLYIAEYSPFQNRRHEVKPGITGWSQINGRNEMNWEDKFLLDVFYVENCTFILDLKIILRTFILLLKNNSGDIEMKQFKNK